MAGERRLRTLNLNNNEENDFKNKEIHLFFDMHIDKERIARYYGITRRTVDDKFREYQNQRRIAAENPANNAIQNQVNDLRQVVANQLTIIRLLTTDVERLSQHQNLKKNHSRQCNSKITHVFNFKRKSENLKVEAIGKFLKKRFPVGGKIFKKS